MNKKNHDPWTDLAMTQAAVAVLSNTHASWHINDQIAANPTVTSVTDTNGTYGFLAAADRT